jgi:hypothetical protein
MTILVAREAISGGYEYDREQRVLCIFPTCNLTLSPYALHHHKHMLELREGRYLSALLLYPPYLE